MNKIYVVPNFCDCGLCCGHKTVQTVLDREAFLASRSEGYQARLIGGRNPRLVIFDARAFYIGNVSASGRVEVTDPFLSDNYLHLGLCGKEVFSDKDSVHGCWKISENQRFSLFLRPSYYAEEVEVVKTR